MPDLKKLREDIEKFPERRSEINLKGNFREYSEKVGQLYLKLKASIEDAVRIEKSSGKENFDKNGVLSEIKTAIREAKKLKQSIEEDANSVASKATENAVVRMNEKATRSSTKCRDGWNSISTGTLPNGLKSRPSWNDFQVPTAVTSKMPLEILCRRETEFPNPNRK